MKYISDYISCSKAHFTSHMCVSTFRNDKSFKNTHKCNSSRKLFNLQRKVWTTEWFESSVLFALTIAFFQNENKNFTKAIQKTLLFSEHILCNESVVIIKKIRHLRFDIFIRFGLSWIHLCYFCGDAYMYVCVCVPVNPIASK